MKKILIRGYYGQNNLGDDFILYSILDTLNSIGKFEVMVLSGGSDYQSLYKKFDNLKCSSVPLSSWRKFKKANILRKVNYQIIGGGGLWPNENPDGLDNTLKELKMAKMLHVKTIYYGIDINSMNQDASKVLWKQISEFSDFMVCRNKRTKDMLEESGCTNIYRSSDLTFGLITEQERNNDVECLTKIGCEQHKYIIWGLLMPWPKGEFNENQHGARYKLLVDNLVHIANLPEFSGYTHVFLPFHYQMELPLLEELTSRIEGKPVICDLSKGLDIGEKRLLFKYARMCITMKFHGAMFSIYSGTPAAVVSYSEKTSDVLREFGLDKYVTEYGIRDSQDFMKSFDLNINEFEQVVKLALSDSATTDFLNAGNQLKEMSECATKLLKTWLQ